MKDRESPFQDGNQKMAVDDELSRDVMLRYNAVMKAVRESPDFEDMKQGEEGDTETAKPKPQNTTNRRNISHGGNSWNKGQSGGQSDRKTYAMKNEGYVICPLCWDGDFGEPAGTHKSVTPAQVNYCKSKNFYFCLCGNHQKTYWSAVKGEGPLNRNDFMDKLKALKEEISGDATDRYTVEEQT